MLCTGGVGADSGGTRRGRARGPREGDPRAVSDPGTGRDDGQAGRAWARQASAAGGARRVGKQPGHGRQECEYKHIQTFRHIVFYTNAVWFGNSANTNKRNT